MDVILSILMGTATLHFTNSFTHTYTALSVFSIPYLRIIIFTVLARLARTQGITVFVL